MKWHWVGENLDAQTAFYFRRFNVSPTCHLGVHGAFKRFTSLPFTCAPGTHQTCKYPLVNIDTAFTKPLFSRSVIGALQMFIYVRIDPCLSMQRLDPGKVNWKTRQQNSWGTFSHAGLKVCRRSLLLLEEGQRKQTSRFFCTSHVKCDEMLAAAIAQQFYLIGLFISQGTTASQAPLRSIYSTKMFGNSEEGAACVAAQDNKMPKHATYSTFLWPTAYRTPCERSSHLSVSKHWSVQVRAHISLWDPETGAKKKGAERPSSWRGATLQAIHHLAGACLSSFPLRLSPSLSTALYLFSSLPLKKKPPPLWTPHLPPRPLRRRRLSVPV